jgi:hypothetical protein
MRFILCFLVCLSALALAPAQAGAEEFAAAIGQTGIFRCRMDVCAVFLIEDAKPVGSTKDGALFVLAAKTWVNEYKARGDSDEHEYDRPPVGTGEPEAFVTFVFCSKTKPVEFFFSDGKWMAQALRPGDAAAISVFVEHAYNFYWAACHGVIVKDPVSVQLADQLGYRFRGHPVPGDGAGGAKEIQPLDVLR